MLNARAARTVAEVRARRAMRLTRPRRRLPRQLPPDGIARDYAIELSRRVVRAIETALAPLLAMLPELLASAARERSLVNDARDLVDTLDTSAVIGRSIERMDAGEGKRVREAVARAKREIEESLDSQSIEELAGKFAARTATYQRIQLARQTQAALGADVFAGDDALQSLVEIFTSENVALIKNLGGEIAARVEKRVLSGVQGGMLHGDLAKQVQADMGIGKTRAKLIARDQVGKLYGQVNAARQRDMGATHFIWRTSRDARVRPEHVARDGQRYAYSDPPDGELPGEPILCRCFAEPDFSALLGEIEPGAKPVAEPEPDPVPEPVAQTPKALDTWRVREQKHHDKLPAAQREALAQYKGAMYRPVNGMLRGTIIPKRADDLQRLATLTRTLDDAMLASPKRPAMVAFRGTTKLPADLETLEIGSTFVEPGFVSTSASRQTAVDFIAFGDKRATAGAVLEIEMAANARAVHLPTGDQMIDEEFELLLPRDSKFEVISKRTETVKSSEDVDMSLTVYRVRLVR